MTLLTDDSAVMVKTRELCASIVEDANFQMLTGRIEAFLEDDAARLQYESVNERGEELRQKQRSGIELSSREISEFEEARDALLANDVARDFLEAQRELENLQSSIGKHIGMTLELGRIPTADDFANASGGGCCGGGGGGCGCN
jgi:cell fate (sporulation/competence/biofilm development) regulator YlbF (YheA/YmcA/DUF963 family)